MHRDNLKGSFKIRFDGSWSCKRNAMHCIVELINDENKIIDFEIITRSEIDKSIKAKRAGDFQNDDVLTWVDDEGKYLGPSNMMEDYFVAVMSSRWKEDPNLKSYIHDGDTKTPKYWKTDEDHGNISELHDIGHMKKCIKRMFKDHPNKSKI